jgi:NADPH:quinone reductase-like Zn-dependent oxidoreductase
MLKALPNHSTLCSYGAMSGKKMELGVGELVFGGKRVEGFWVSEWFRQASTPDVCEMMDTICGLHRSGKLLSHIPLNTVQFDDITDGSELDSRTLIVM